MGTKQLKTIICTFFCIFFTLTSNAQNHSRVKGSYSVEGVLTDSITKQTEPYATIKIFYQETPQKPVRIAVTNENGGFQESLAMPGEYVISLSSIGKLTVTRKFNVTDTHKAVNLGTLYTAESSEMLKGVEVVAQKPLVKADIDKIAYSIEDDPDSKTNTMLEMLKKVPLVTVDGEDNIQVNGSGNFKVHVNGKPNTLMSNNPKEVLRSLPANTVKSIEVITEPGAKYDAEGIGGILNIITTHSQMQGYNVTLGSNVNNKGAGGYAFGTVQVGKFTVSGNYSYNYYDQSKGYSKSGREDFTSDQLKHLTTDGIADSYGQHQFGTIEGSYEIDKQNLITFSSNFYGGDFNSKNRVETRMKNHLLENVYGYHTKSLNKGTYGNTGINLDYQHSFKKQGEYLTLSYRYNRSPNDSKATTDYFDITGALPFSLQNQHFDNDAHSGEHTAQIDYANPINKMHYIDAGMKYIFRDNASDSKYFYEQENGEMVMNEKRSSIFNQGQDILAAYADYQLKWKRFGFKAGVRYEHTFMDIKYKQTPDRNFHTDFDDIVPTVNVSYMLGTTSSLRANYNMRINRPGIWYLNPFRDESNPTSVSYGNPNLDTEKAHIVGLTYSRFSAKFSANIGMSHMFINNGIESYSFMNNGVMENTYRNAGKTQRTSLSLWINWNPGSTTRISLNAGGNYADFKSNELNIRNHGFSGNFFGNIQQTLPWDLRFSAYGGGSTPSISLQGKGSSYYYYGINLSRSFLKDKRLTVSAFANNLFNKYLTFNNQVNTDTFRSWSENKNNAQNFGISVNWRFGKLKAQVKKTARSITNDDVKAGGENNSNGGGQSSTLQ